MEKMSPDVKERPREEVPTLSGALAFRAKAALLRLRRHALNRLVYRDARHPAGGALTSAQVVAESRTRLRAGGEAGESLLQSGKVHNLRLAARRLDGVEVPAGAVFSFWAHVGRATRRRGYVRGRELREGCIIPAVGGGLCQLSNALYDAALQAGCEIVERHAHTRVVPGSQAAAGRDATVFWNYVDLRWRSPRALRVEASLSRDQLVVRLRADAAGERATRAAGERIHANGGAEPRATHAIRGRAEAPPAQASDSPFTQAPASPSASGECSTCGVFDCFRNAAEGDAGEGAGRTAFLLDEFWPEFDAYVRGERRGADLLCLPLDGKRFGRANYAWDTSGFGAVRERRLDTALRSLASRRLAAQGAARQRALLAHARRVAEGHAASLAFDVTHVVVMQHLLPHLWLGGHLGGRSFDVLMGGPPLWRLHEALDSAAALHPESPTLADFRADESLVRAEREALAAARRVVTPHAAVASLFGGRALRLGWSLPRAERVGPCGARAVFPGPTVGRRGAYELREAVRRTGIGLVVTGSRPEGADFWDGLNVERAVDGDWLRGAGVVVLPAFVENRPRRLLEALARGVPVVASRECGLGGMEGVYEVAAGDVDALCRAMEKALASRPPAVTAAS